MYAIYDNTLYHMVKKAGRYNLVTRNPEKTDSSFYPHLEVFVKEIAADDPKLQDMYDVEFYVVYHDDSGTMKQALEHLNSLRKKGIAPEKGFIENVIDHVWCVTENHAYQDARIENDEVTLIMDGSSHSEDWKQIDKFLCSKQVSIYDCEKLFVRYLYSMRGRKNIRRKRTCGSGHVAGRFQDGNAEIPHTQPLKASSPICTA